MDFRREELRANSNYYFHTRTASLYFSENVCFSESWEIGVVTVLHREVWQHTEQYSQSDQS